MSVPATQPALPADWHDWPIIPDREGYSTTRHREPMYFVSRNQMTIAGHDVVTEQLIAAIADEVRFLTKDSRVRIGRLKAENGPADTPTLRLEYLEDQWTAFIIDLWISSRLGSFNIVMDEWLFGDGSWLGKHLPCTSHGSWRLTGIVDSCCRTISWSLVYGAVYAILASLVSIPVLHIAAWILGRELGPLDKWPAPALGIGIGCAVLAFVSALALKDLLDRTKDRVWACGLYVRRKAPLRKDCKQRQWQFSSLAHKAVLNAFARCGIPQHAIA
jgi:hypothetical protein